MYRQESKFENGQEVVMNIKMSAEEMNKIRNESLDMLKKCLENGTITEEEYIADLKDMGIYIKDEDLNIDRLECVYSVASTRRIMQSLNYDLSKNIITSSEYEACKLLIILGSDSVSTINVRCTEDHKTMLKVLADNHNRSITKEIIQMIEDSYKIMSKPLKCKDCAYDNNGTCIQGGC